MDMRLQGETGTPPTWDFLAELLPGGGHIIAVLSGAAERLQQAQVASTMQIGTVPQLPTAGVDHLGFIGGTVTFGQLDAQIRQFLVRVGITDYYPDYDIVNHGLVVQPKKVGS